MQTTLVRLSRVRAWRVAVLCAAGTLACSGAGLGAPDDLSAISVSVAPDDRQIAVGESIQLSATVNGNGPHEVMVEWSSSDAGIASVTPTGVVAGVAPGTARIRVRVTPGGAMDSADVEVVPEPPGTARIDTIFYDGFESGTLSSWQDGVQPSHQAIRTSSSFARVGTRYLELMLPEGETDAWLTRFFMPGYDSVYVRMYVRFPPTWTGGTKVFALHGSPIDDLWGGFGNAGHCPDGTDFFSSDFTTERQYDPGPVHFYTYYVGMPSTGGCWGSIGTGQATYTHENSGLTRDVWHKVEYWIRLNAPGGHDGVQRFWIDDALWGEWGGISYRTTVDLMLNSLQLQLQNPGHSVYYDDILITTAKP